MTFNMPQKILSPTIEICSKISSLLSGLSRLPSNAQPATSNTGQLLFLCQNSAHGLFHCCYFIADLCYTIWKLFGLFTAGIPVFHGFSLDTLQSRALATFALGIWAVFCGVFVIARWPHGTSTTCACFTGPVFGSNRATFARFMRIIAGVPWHRRYVRRNHGYVRGTSRTWPSFSGP